ncbi:MAG: coproporphyrinogen III oxidase [Alphaproteobacteria bacterium]|nr:coproporphyrinogen III oxidase [Alphaproteobacteria bacterium]MDE2493037.1 coproporphyrinogen III oxidase [Alphaproteobacteria bacterium]
MSGFGLYVHWPFCTAKCPYCDFNSHVRSSIDEDGWLEAVLRELAYVAELQSDDRPILQTIFFGGGTPSLMSGRAVGRVIDEAARLWRSANDLEITMEANPASADAARFADYAKAGVGRLSLGVQALNDADLKFLGRLHNVGEAKAALALAQRTFPRVSFDLIYARPNQSVTAWREELAEALSFGTEHLSLYQLTIEPGTPFAALHRQGALRIPEDDLGAAFYEATQDVAAAGGLPAYEVSNHARPGCESRHNLLYWRYGSYAGVGAGAHGRLDLGGKRFATVCERLPERWREKVMSDGHGFIEMSEIEPRDAAREHLMMNMRLNEGLDLGAYYARWGLAPPPQRIAALVEARLVRREHDRLSATPQGMLLLNRVIAELTL